MRNLHKEVSHKERCLETELLPMAYFYKQGLYKDISYRMDHPNHIILCFTLLHEVLTNLKYHFDKGKEPELGLFVYALICEASKGHF